MPRWTGLGPELWFSMRTGQSNFHARWRKAFSLMRAFWADLARGVGPRYHRSAGLVGPYRFRDAFRGHGPGITKAVRAREHESWQGLGWAQR